MNDKTGWVYKLVWRNPYTEPPNGLPRVLAEWTDKKPSLDDFKAVYPEYCLGCGFGLVTVTPTKPIKKLDPAVNKRRKERARKTQKANWLKKNMPLLADVIIEEEGLDWRAAL